MKELIFIHTPKCAGSYINNILSYLGIESKKHNQASLHEKKISFTVIRDPIERYESLLNYRLSSSPRFDWPSNLTYVYHTNLSLNEIVSKMTDAQILGFFPYQTLVYWTTNVDIVIKLEDLPQLLQVFGYTYDTTLFEKQNVSPKVRGTFNEKTRNRIKELYKDDMVIFNNCSSLAHIRETYSNT